MVLSYHCADWFWVSGESSSWWVGWGIFSKVTIFNHDNVNFLLQTLMGVFYYIEAVALLEDLPLEEESGHHTVDAFIHAVEVGYQRVSKRIVLISLK